MIERRGYTISLKCKCIDYVDQVKKLACSRVRSLVSAAESAGQDAPPTEKVNDTIKALYALLFKRNGISMQYMAILEKGANSYGAYVPDLPGCVAVAETKAEAHKLITEAIQFHIEGLREDGDVVPPPSSTAAFIDIATG